MAAMLPWSAAVCDGVRRAVSARWSMAAMLPCSATVRALSRSGGDDVSRSMATDRPATAANPTAIAAQPRATIRRRCGRGAPGVGTPVASVVGVSMVSSVESAIVCSSGVGTTARLIG